MAENKMPASLEEQIAEKDAWIAKQQEFLEYKDALLADRESAIAQKDAWIGKQQELLEYKDALLAEKEAAIAQKDEWIGKQEEMLAYKDGLLAAKEAEAVESAKVLAEKDAAIEKLNAKITENLNLGSESVIHTVNEEGQITAIYEVNEDGEVELVESFVKVEPVVDNGPSPEMIRHWMEELRQQQAIGGVYGSPYWLKQLYLGYHSLELRLYENGERELFREMLSWYNGGPEKRLTLRVNVENPQDLTMRLDGEVIDILERCEFAVITLQDKNKNVVMEYNVADLKAARALYGLARTDLLCVGGPDSEVMKIGADGQMVSVEQDAAK